MRKVFSVGLKAQTSNTKQQLGEKKKMDIQIEKLQEVLSKEVEKYYTKQLKSTITEIKTY